jgi:GalNAc5-diNAcBac-PP-undecaprenol beta-1,3-glucosyltransferase
MTEPVVSVVVTTHERPDIVGRAIESALAQDVPTEVIVVDDASADDTEAVVRTFGDRVRYVRQDVNSGPGAARNRGIQEATGEWVVPLDDDDELVPGALRQALEAAAGLEHLDRYPVLQFRTTSNISGVGRFTIFDFTGYHSAFRGDLAPMLRRRRFLELGLEYPAIRPAAEHILWLRVAAEHGIPAWPLVLVNVHTDAPHRLTLATLRLARAQEFALMQEETIARLDDVMTPEYRRTRHVAAASYWLLATERQRARRHLGALGLRSDWRVLPLWLLSYAPRGASRLLYIAYGSSRRLAMVLLAWQQTNF